MNTSSRQFEYKELDPEGFETLRVIADARHFNNWTFETIRPYCAGRILEIGSGIGNISSRFLRKGIPISLSDIREQYRTHLAGRFPEISSQIHEIDLVHPAFDRQYTHLQHAFDTVFALNVVEHIRDDRLAIRNAKSLLAPGGTLLILVPAYPALYNSFDRELHHFKRYRAHDLKSIFVAEGFQVQRTFHFNAFGIPGWLWSGSVMKKKIIPAGEMKLFDLLVPVFRWLDPLLLNQVGLSLVMVGKKIRHQDSGPR